MQRLHFYDREDRPWVNRRLTTASIVGHTTATTVRLWIRASEPGPYHLLVAREPIPSLGLPEIQTTSGGNLRAALVGLFDRQKEPLRKVTAIEPHEFTFRGDLAHVFDFRDLKPNSTLRPRASFSSATAPLFSWWVWAPRRYPPEKPASSSAKSPRIHSTAPCSRTRPDWCGSSSCQNS